MTVKVKQTILNTGRRLCAAVLACLCLLGIAAVLSNAARAQQEAYYPPVQLKEDQSFYDLGPSMYIVRDPEQTMQADDVMRRYRSGQQSDTAGGRVLPLGSKPSAFWLIVPVVNNSWNADWILTLGSNMRGRIGKVSQIRVFDAVSKARYVDTISTVTNPYLTQGAIIGNTVPVKMEQGQRSILVMYVVPEPGMPTTIAPALVSAHVYTKMRSSILTPRYLFLGAVLLCVGFFICTITVQQIWSNLIFVIYAGGIVLLYQMMDAEAYTKMTFSSELFGLVFGAQTIVGLVMARIFLDIKKFYLIQNRAMTLFTLLIVLSTLTAAFVVKDSTLIKPVMIFLPSFAGMALAVMLGFAQAQSGKYGANLFAAAWIVSIIGFIVTFVSACGLVSPTPMMVGAYWLSLIPQILLLMTASIVRTVAIERDIRLEKQKKDDEAESIAQLRQSRDASENARLLRVIEHERQVMNELRDREIKQSEDMRSARDAADEANRAKSAFLAVISHEIRTPMSGIMGMVRLLLETSLTREQADYAQTIQDFGDAMLSLLNDILDFEKIESGKMELEHIDFDLARLILGVVTLMSGHAETKGLSLKADIDPSLPRFVIGDPVRLRQVILNLVGNAIKFTDHGSVTIHVRRDNSGEQRHGIVRLRIAIQDTGVGISREAQKNLFNPFAQADASVSRRFGGTGLGLAISQRLIETMGGRITIDSIEGRGSTFYFILMMEEGSAEGAEKMGAAATSLSQKSSRSLKILVVEDNEVSQKLMKEFISRMGHDLTLAGTGEAALALIDKPGKFDMVLMDIELPGISGMGATKAIRAMKDDALAGLPVIAMTGNVRDEDIRNCYTANMNGHISKPVDPQKLREAIQKVIDGKLDNPVVINREEEFKQPEEVRIAATVSTGLRFDEDDEGILKNKEDALESASGMSDAGTPKLPLSEASAFGGAPIFSFADDDTGTAENVASAEDKAAQEKAADEIPVDDTPDSAEIDLGASKRRMTDTQPAQPPASAAKPQPETKAEPEPDFAPAKTLSLQDDKAPIHSLLMAAEEFELNEDELSSDSFADAIAHDDTIDDGAPVGENETVLQPPAPDMTGGLSLMEDDPSPEKAAAVAVAQVFDTKMLDSLRTSMKSADLKQLVDEMLEKTDQIIRDLGIAKDENNATGMAARAHELKGMAGNFGLKELSQIAAKAEQDAKQFGGMGIGTFIKELNSANERAKTMMTEWLSVKPDDTPPSA